MAGDILIIDCVATNRIVLKVKLLAAQYRVRPCASIDEAHAEIGASLPDLILVDTCVETAAAHDFCRSLKSDPNTSLIPIIATGGFATPRDRVDALEAGADDVLSKPFDDHILQARIRCLLRGRDARQELRMREGTRTALGFAESCETFTAPARIIIASDGMQPAADLRGLGTALDNVVITPILAGNLIRGDIGTESADLYMLDFRAGLADDKELYRLLSELRSRSATRHAAILALLPIDARQAAAMALDLGANDIVCADADPAEMCHRCTRLIQAKHEADALRRTVETGLEAAITD
ncbi:MAG: response regulator, partial [Octadecabacter sp.]